ncbi:matrix-remodeling-associated protein 7 isoform X2 [Colius striatus]|uniref:matrix-remodeling-associated protein 7 isoform X2 n=1 Tax=Colius striatus TaxID=57412 RepID=UPI002B1DD3DD|nr:matrix-remodeling-associated protein 7 isoform X2 [Colius striatus]
MDVAVDLYLAVPLLFTVLALVLAALFVRMRAGEGERAAERPREPAAAEPAREDSPGAGGQAEAAGSAEEPRAEGTRVSVEEVGAGQGAAAEPGPAAAGSVPGQPAQPRREPGRREHEESQMPPLDASAESNLGHMGQAEDGGDHEVLSSQEEDLDSENEKLVVREPEDEDAADETFSFKYSPGKLRGNQYKSMMTKEELEEEQRVQREQLAAIFRLMKEKSDTFGEMSEGDMKEQLRLYDI